MLKAVFFDLDGTLIDSYVDIGIHLNATLRDFGRDEVDIQSVRHMIGGGAKSLLARFFDKDLEEALSVFRNYYMEKPVIYTKPYNGVEDILRKLKDMGFYLGVITNKMEALSRRILEHLNLDSYFNLVIGGDTFEEKKPSPLPVIKALELLGISKNEALMIGDTDADITAGKLAGTKTALALWGYVKHNGQKPDFFLESVYEIDDLIKRLSFL